jgi:elongation factor Ts
MQIDATMVKELREKTGVGMMKCKKALQDAGGNVGEAEKLLRKQGMAAAAKRAGRTAGEGTVASYIHTGGKIGVLLEINCETDFAARSDDFAELVRGLTMHIAAAAPNWVRREDVPESILNDEREIARAQAVGEGKPEKILDKIVEGRVEKFFAQNCMLDQPFVKDPEQTVGQLIGAAVARIGENIQVRRLARFVLGESL